MNKNISNTFGIYRKISSLKDKVKEFFKIPQRVRQTALSSGAIVTLNKYKDKTIIDVYELNKHNGRRKIKFNYFNNK